MFYLATHLIIKKQWQSSPYQAVAGKNLPVVAPFVTS